LKILSKTLAEASVTLKAIFEIFLNEAKSDEVQCLSPERGAQKVCQPNNLGRIRAAETINRLMEKGDQKPPLLSVKGKGGVGAMQSKHRNFKHGSALKMNSIIQFCRLFVRLLLSLEIFCIFFDWSNQCTAKKCFSRIPRPKS
jgi:hypothetical protein